MKCTFAGMVILAALATAGAPAMAADGKAVYESTCFACHATGAAGAPKFRDKAAWAPRAINMTALKAVALRGKGIMPARGGNSNLSDADVIAATEYMVSQAR